MMGLLRRLSVVLAVIVATAALSLGQQADPGPEAKPPAPPVVEQGGPTIAPAQSTAGEAGPAHGASASRDPARATRSRRTGGQAHTQQQPGGWPAVDQSQVETAAMQMLTSLDAVIALAQRREDAGTPQLARMILDRDKLQQRAKAATDEAAWIGVAGTAAEMLGDAWRMINAGPLATAPGSRQGASTASAMPVTAPPSVNPEAASPSSPLPLYISLASLVLALLTPGLAWLLARREIKKALIDAGLI